MTEAQSPANGPQEGRLPDGRFAPGNSLGTPFGPDNPPPRSPGRPKKDAWLYELEQRPEDPRMRQAIADRILKIALKGSEKAALQAAQLIQDRVAGPVTQRIEAEVVPRQIIVMGCVPNPPKLPDAVLAIEQARLDAEERAQVKREG
jgi:hypothetical protein